MTDRAERIAVFHRPEIYRHDPGPGFFEAPRSPLLEHAEPHPETATRVRNMCSVLERGPIRDDLDWNDCELATVDELCRFHERRYVDRLLTLDDGNTHRLTESTVFAPGTWPAILAAAGAAVAAVAHVREHAGGKAYALVRPPGHHAQPDRSDGYCFANNIGVAIEAARAAGMKRAAVIDWDVHHGNGTEAGFYHDADVLTVSIHMDHGAWGASHPQTGAVESVGRGEGLGANLNLPLPFGSGDSLYLAAFDTLVARAVRAHRPELIVVAAGQDACQFDPNGRQCLTMAGFNQLGQRARSLADEICGGRLALVQEGGYAPSYAAFCLHATLEGVLGRRSMLRDPIGFLPDEEHGEFPILGDLARRWEAAAMG